MASLVTTLMFISNGCAWISCRKDLPHNTDPDHVDSPPKSERGGWSSIPYILSNELTERLAAVGISLNLISYLMQSYHMSQVTAASILSVVGGTASLTPLVGAFLSDAYLGRFWTIVMGSISQFIASFLLTATAAWPSLRPPSGSRERPSPGDLAFLLTALGTTTVAAGALRPCSYAFGTDQLIERGDPVLDKQNTQSFFNWYFFFLYCSILGGATVLVYLQDNQGWLWGFSVPTALSALAITLLFLGRPRFRCVPPTGSPFTVFARVLVAAVCKAKHPFPPADDDLFRRGKCLASSTDDQLQANDVDLPHTQNLRWLDHAAIVTDSDKAVGESGISAMAAHQQSFRLCTVSEVEQLKAVVALAPIWIVNMISTTVLSVHGAFNVPQARRMDRHIGSSGFNIPPASMSVFSSITLVLWMPLYDRVMVPKARRITGHPGGIKVLQRIGIGYFLSVIGLLVSGCVEMRRRELGVRHNERLSAMWLVPQHCLTGLGESFHAVGQLEFLYDQLPTNMRSVAGAVFWCSAGMGHYGGTVVLQLVHQFSAAAGAVDWLADDINRGHLDYFLFLLTFLQAANFLLYLVVTRYYTYRDLSACPSSEVQMAKALSP